MRTVLRYFNMNELRLLWAKDSLEFKGQESFTIFLFVFARHSEFALVSYSGHNLVESVILSGVVDQFYSFLKADSFDRVEVVTAREDAGCHEHLVIEFLEALYFIKLI